MIQVHTLNQLADLASLMLPLLTQNQKEKIKKYYWIAPSIVQLLLLIKIYAQYYGNVTTTGSQPV